MKVDSSARFKELIYSIMTGSADFYFLVHEVEDVNAASVDEHGQHLIPINEAVRMGEKRFFEYLVEEGASIECQDHLGRTPLLWAASRNQVALMKNLIDLGADLKKTDRKGNNALLLAIKDNKTEAALSLLEIGFDIDAKNLDGDTAVQLCASSGNAALLKEILKFRPALNTKDILDTSPFYAAIYGNKLDCLRLLVDHGVDVHEMAEYEASWGVPKLLTPLEFCEQNLNVKPEIAEFLKSIYEMEQLTGLIKQPNTIISGMEF